MIGKVVIHQSSGRRLGQVSDLLLDPTGRRVEALVLGRGILQGRACAVPVASIAGMGPDAVLVDDDPVDPDAAPGKGNQRWSEMRRLSGKPVLTRTGTELGVLDDVLFDEASGNVTGYRLSGGFVADLLDGRQTLAPTGLTVGDEALLADGVPELDLGPSVEG